MAATSTTSVITLRLTPDLHSVIRVCAGERGQSLQTWLVRAAEAAAMHQAQSPGGEAAKAALDRLAKIRPQQPPPTRRVKALARTLK